MIFDGDPPKWTVAALLGLLLAVAAAMIGMLVDRL